MINKEECSLLELIEYSELLTFSIMLQGTFGGGNFDLSILKQYITTEHFITKDKKDAWHFLSNTEKKDVGNFQKDCLKNLNAYNLLMNMYEEVTESINLKNVALEHLENYYNYISSMTMSVVEKKVYLANLQEIEMMRNDEEVEKSIDELIFEKEERPLISGYEQIDKQIGFRRKNTYIIGAGTGKGKSTLALNVATKLSFRGSKGMYFSLEMTKSEVVKNVTSSLTSINRNDFKHQNFTNQQIGIINSKVEKIKNMPLNIVDNINNFHGIVNAIKQQELDYVVIDYIGLIDHEERDIRIKTSKISRSLKILSKEQDICIIIVAQLNRQSEEVKPEVRHLAESADLERDASGVMLIDRERGSRNADLVVAKNRFGTNEDIPLYFELEYSRIQEGYKDEQNIKF